MLPILLAVLAQALPPPAADEGPTAFACTIDKLLRRERCTFEGLAPPVATPARTLASQNAALAAGAARGCASVPAGALRLGCEREVADASLSPDCTLGGAARLADEAGRLVPAARACVTRLRAALEASEQMAAVSHACCQCLAQRRCGVAELQCNRELFALAPGVELSACVARACSDECAFFTGVADPAPVSHRPASSKPSPKSPAVGRAVPGKI